MVAFHNQFKSCSYSAQRNEPVKTGATHVSMLVGRTVQRNADRYDRIRQGLSSGRQMSVGNAERRQPESRCILRFNRCRQVMAGYDRIPSAGYGKNLENLIGMEGYRLIPIKCNLYSTSYAVDGEAGRGVPKAQLFEHGD